MPEIHPGGALSRRNDPLGLTVDPGDLHIGPQNRGEQKRPVTGSTADVEHRLDGLQAKPIGDELNLVAVPEEVAVRVRPT
jgi:hypothetical protein